MTTTGIIKTRREQIEQDARCDGCGATLASCKAQRGKDPAAPPWFGCCARGLLLEVPCNHQIDQSRLLGLVREIESGSVAEARPSSLDQHLSQTYSTWRYLNQGDWWQPKPPAKPVRIADMEPEWRYNATRWLLRRAPYFADRYSWGMLASGLGPLGPSGDAACDAFEAAMAELDREQEDPQRWIRGTVLYQALIAGLPGKPRTQFRLWQRARHWSPCLVRARNSAECACPTGKEPPTADVVRQLTAPVLVVSSR